jgi:type IV pilus assembly protein PilW
MTPTRKNIAYRQSGITLIEVMISLVIGLVIVIAVMVTYVGSSRSSRFQAAYSQMNEDAQVAMALLQRDIQLAGYARPTAINGGNSFTPTFVDRPVVGCDQGFSAAPAVASSTACNAAAGSPAIEVGYEADVQNTVPTGAGVPSDCLGAALPVVAGAQAYYIARNRFYIANSAVSGRPELHCSSYPNAASRAGQPLVENIESWQIWYGERNAEVVVPAPRQIVRYVTAANVADWNNVLAVKICILVRSSERVVIAEEPVRYLDCNLAQQVVNDGLLRRAYFVTSTLRSKMSF